MVQLRLELSLGCRNQLLVAVGGVSSLPVGRLLMLALGEEGVGMDVCLYWLCSYGGWYGMYARGWRRGGGGEMRLSVWARTQR